MLWSRQVLLIVAILFASASAFAKDDHQTLQENLCERMLGVTLVSADPKIEFAMENAFGMRGYLGAYPEASAANAALLEPLGIHWWGHSFAVKKTIEEAKTHDSAFSGLSKIAYLISDVDVSDLTDDTPKEIVRARFVQIMANAKMIYWDDSEAIISKQDIPPKYVEADMAIARRLIHEDTVDYFTLDDRGPRFGQGGWVFPAIRGELNYAKLFESGSGSIKEVERHARKLERRGYTFTFNQNFLEALNAARDQIRVQKNPVTGKQEKVPANSRYFSNKSDYDLALDGYATGHSFSVETRDANGKLIAGILGVRNGNLISLETIFYGYETRPDGTFRSNLDEAKVAVVAAVKRLKEHGLEVSDVRMVTPFTASMKGEYVSAAVFLDHVKKLNALGPVEIDFSKPWVPEPAAN